MLNIQFFNKVSRKILPLAVLTILMVSARPLFSYHVSNRNSRNSIISDSLGKRNRSCAFYNYTLCERRNAALEKEIFPADMGRDITLNNVSFSYDRFAPMPTIDDISLKIESGKVTALVGASGSGKTTIMKLILGCYKNFTGSIEVGDGNLLDYNMDSWRSKCGIVMQDGVILMTP